jgi:large subunit ribosomal protein L15
VVVNLSALEERFPAGSVVDEKTLRASGLVKGQEHDGIKILATGALSKPLEVHATKFSASAASKIAAAGGKTVIVPYRPHAFSGRSENAAASGD